MELLGRCSTGSFTEQDCAELLRKTQGTWLQSLRDSGMIRESIAPNHADVDLSRPGIHRLQHSALLYRSHKAGILVDPNFHFAPKAALGGRTINIKSLVENVTCILISHSHNDHLSFPSLLIFPRDTLIVVPEVSRGSLLCDRMDVRLRSLGFTNVVTKPWYCEPFQVEDITVQALPFYGEQATLEESASCPDLRNWGNTYWLELNGFKSWLLIDAGSDREGKMLDVADFVLSTHGPTDCLLSNMREFTLASPFYINLGANWLTLSMDQKIRFHTMSTHSITLGVDGVGAVCKASQARFFLPYSHWWQEPGKMAPDEKARMEKLTEILRTLGSPTRVVEWPIGGHFLP